MAKTLKIVGLDGMKCQWDAEQRRVVGSSIKSRLCVNGSPIKYGFLAGLRAIHHSMIIAQVSCLTITLLTKLGTVPCLLPAG